MLRQLVIVGMMVVMVASVIQIQQQNATNQTGNYSAQAKPDQTKFCAEFNNDDGTTGESCEYKSNGECKKGSIAAGDDFRECKKRD